MQILLAEFLSLPLAPPPFLDPHMRHPADPSNESSCFVDLFIATGLMSSGEKPPAWKS